MTLEIPPGMTAIGDSVFAGCRSLEEIAIPAGVTWIGSAGFRGCSIGRLSMPSRLSNFGGERPDAFEGVTKLSLVEPFGSVLDPSIEAILDGCLAPGARVISLD